MKRFLREKNPIEMINDYKKREIAESTKVEGSYECQYVLVPWKEEEDLNLNPFLSYREAQEAGEKFYPDGYDIEEYRPEDDDDRYVSSSLNLGDRINPADVADYADKVDPIDDYSYLDEEDEDSSWELLDRKDILDYDDFWTKYSLYKNEATGQYVTVYGDPDLYRPEDGDFDMEFDSEDEAWDFFYDYEVDPELR